VEPPPGGGRRSPPREVQLSSVCAVDQDVVLRKKGIFIVKLSGHTLTNHPQKMQGISALAFLSAALVSAQAPGKTYPGPTTQAGTQEWLSNLYALRQTWRASVNYTSSVYDNYLTWSPTMFIAPQSHIYDRMLYDNVAGEWTVDKFLDDLSTRYGGIDGVLLWGTYPNMGIDERSQFDILEDVPGGLAKLKEVVSQFNQRGVHVGLPYNP
jgi:iron(II)-dependent oxidoreductase